MSGVGGNHHPYRHGVRLTDGETIFVIEGGRGMFERLEERVGGLETAVLERVVQFGATSWATINPDRALKFAQRELDRRRGVGPSRERALDTGVQVQSRRRWIGTGVLTNYFNPGAYTWRNP